MTGQHRAGGRFPSTAWRAAVRVLGVAALPLLVWATLSDPRATPPAGPVATDPASTSACLPALEAADAIRAHAEQLTAQVIVAASGLPVDGSHRERVDRLGELGDAYDRARQTCHDQET